MQKSENRRVERESTDNFDLSNGIVEQTDKSEAAGENKKHVSLLGRAHGESEKKVLGVRRLLRKLTGKLSVIHKQQ